MARVVDRGAAVVVALLVLAIALLVAWVVLDRYAGGSSRDQPATATALDGARQQRTLADMRAIARANEMMRVDTGSYASRLADLEAGRYLQQVPATDGWGNRWEYRATGSGYSLISLGADGRAGPPPPAPWDGAPYDPDLVLTDGQLTQAPSGR